MSHVDHDTILFTGIMFLLLLFVGILGFDGYIFYRLTAVSDEHVPYATSSAAFSTSDIDAALMALDERQRKFDTILQPTIPYASSSSELLATSTQNTPPDRGATSSPLVAPATTTSLYDFFPWTSSATSFVGSAMRWMNYIFLGADER